MTEANAIEARHALWCQRKAESIRSKLVAAYMGGSIASILFGSELEQDLRKWMESSISQALTEWSCMAQGLESEMRRARDVLPPDWEQERFDRIVRQGREGGDVARGDRPKDYDAMLRSRGYVLEEQPDGAMEWVLRKEAYDAGPEFQ